MTRSALALALLMAAYGAWSGPILLAGSDSWWHVAQVERLVQLGEWWPRGPHGEVYLNAGVWHAVLAGACRLLRWQAIQVWIFLPALMAPLLVLVAAWAGRRFVGPGRGEAYATLAFVVLFEGSHLDPWREAGYPRYVNWIPLLFALGCAVEYVDTGRRRHLVLGALAGALTAVVHLVELALLGLLLGFFGLVLLFLGGRERFRWCGRAVVFGLLTLALALPYLKLAAGQGMPVVQAATAGTGLDPERFRDMLHLSDGAFVLDPTGEFGAIAGWTGLLAVLGVPWLVPLARRRPGAALCLAGLLGPPCLVFNPILLPLFLRYWPAPEVLHRLALIMLVPWGAAAVFLAVREAPPPAGRMGRVARGLLLLGLPLSALPPVFARLSGLEQVRWNKELEVVAPWFETAAFLSAHFPARTVILSDPLTSQVMAGLGGFGIVEHGTAGHSTADARPLTPAGAFFRNPCQTSAGALAALRESGVALVLVNRAPAPPTYQIQVYRDAYYGPGTAALLRDNPLVFPPVRDFGGLSVFACDPAAAPRLAGKDVSAAERKRGLLVLPGVPSPDAPVLAHGLSPVRPPEWRARRGGRLEGAIDWVFTAPGDDFLKVRFHLINHGGEGAWYRAWYGKVHRKIVERLEGRIYRSGFDADLVPEEYQVLPVERGDAVRQSIALGIPDFFAAGTYDVRAEVLRKGRADRKRLTVSDLPWPGQRIGSLVIE